MSANLVLKIGAFIFILQLLLFIPEIVCETATPEEMDLVCANWLTQTISQRGNWAGAENPKILEIKEIFEGNTLLARCYNIAPNGFILIPALKGMNPIKAYSEKYSLDDDQVDGFLRFIREILQTRYELYCSLYGSLEAVQPHSEQALFGIAHEESWERLTLPETKFEKSLIDNASLNNIQGGPLLTSSWHQNAPYNNLCPDGDVGTCLVGCVAVAGAQILNYWQWPPHGVGSKSYDWDGDKSCGDTNAIGTVITVDLANLYDWENMPDSCDSGCTIEDSSSLAELNYEVAVAMETRFGSCGSASSSKSAIDAYENYFMYDAVMSDIIRDDYTLENWFDVIQTEINNNRPIQYFCTGHSVVCDGYRINGTQYEFHINYGWGGPFSAWYVLDSLNYKQFGNKDDNSKSVDHMIIEIMPQINPHLEFTGITITDSLGNNNGHANAGDTVEISFMARNNGFSAYDVTAFLTCSDPYISILEENAILGDSIGWGEEMTSLTSFKFVINPLIPDPYLADFQIEIDASNSSPVNDSFNVFIGDATGFVDDMENGYANWTVPPAQPPYVNEWHLEDYRFHSPFFSWKAGGLADGNYANNSDSKLISKYILLPVRPRMSFWHHINAELNIYDSSAFDGGYVMISTGGEDWEIIYPEDGYPYYNFGIPCFSSDTDWNNVEFDLQDYSGVVRFMLIFFSDRRGTNEGWYIDDFKVFSGVLCGDVNSDEIINISDIVFLANYIFINGSTVPDPLCSADADGDGTVNISDTIWIINYIFLGGEYPVSGCCDG